MPATTRGAYFNATLDYFARHTSRDEAERLCAELGIPAAYGDLQHRAIADFVRLQDAVARRLLPGKGHAEAMFELGGLACRAFSESLVGKLAVSLFGRNLKKLSERMPSYYASGNGEGTVNVVQVDPRSFRLSFERYRIYPEYHHGLLSAGMALIKPGCRVALQTRRLEVGESGEIDADFDLTVAWE